MGSISTTTPEHVIVFGFIAISIQLIRCCIDMIQSASVKQQAVEDKQESPTKKKSSKTTSSNGTKPPTTETSKLESATNPTSSSSYGSINTPGGTTTTSEDEEQQTPLLSNETNSNAIDTIMIDANHRSRTVKRYRTLFLMMWMIYFVYYTAIWFIQFMSIHLNMGTDHTWMITKIPTTALGMIAWICLLECFYGYSSHGYERYGIVQRVFHTVSSILMCCAIILQLLYTGNYQYTNMMISFSWYELLYVIMISSSLICTLIQVRLLSTSDPTAAASDDDTKKQRVHAFQTSILGPLLKPYFWPDATSQSAIANRIRAISTWVCVILSKVCNLLSPLYLGWASTALAHGAYNKCIEYVILYNIISWFATTLKECQSLVYLEVAQEAFVQLSEKAFGHLHTLSLDWHLRKKLGEVIRSMDRGIAACDTLMKYLFLWLLPAIIECLVVCIIFATYFHYLPLAITIFYFVIFYVVLTILITIHRKQYRKALTKHDNEWHDLFTDSMINFETVKFFTAEKYEQERFKIAVCNYQVGTVHVQASLSFLNISQQVILKLCLATALILATVAIQAKVNCCVELAQCESGISDCCQQSYVCANVGMYIGDFVAVLTYTLNLFAPLNFLGSVYNAIIMAIVDLQNMSELLSENPDVTDAPDAMILPVDKNEDIAVEFDNVVFHYPTQPENRGLKGLSFKMKRGTTTAIVGPTGSGKTTVSRLLFRFYDVLGGAVKVQGMDVRTVTQESLRKAIGVVPQTASMFNDTIRSNLLYGNRTASEQQLVQAATDAQLLTFIESLDDGWDTLVGDRGLKLSGGERQRAAIARCLLKNPPIVLLDEATSALDTITENSVQEALDRLGADRTVLVIAHRLGTIRNADNIIVLKDGVAAEQGTHDELLEKNGIYAEMWNMQLHSAAASASTSRANLLEA